MQPYQEAAEAMKQHQQIPENAVRSAASFATGIAGNAARIAGGAAIFNRMMPLLNKYVPPDLAMKGLNKIDPRLGKFVHGAMGAGYSYDQAKDFLGEKAEEAQPAKDNRSIIEQYSPELFQFLQQEIQRGKSPMQAAGEAQTKVKWSSKFKDSIKKMEKDHKTPFSTIVESIFGGGQMAQPNPQQNNPGNQPSFADDVRQGLQQHQQPQEGQGGPAQSKLTSLIQQYIQSKGR